MDIREIEAACAVYTYKNFSEAAFHIASSASVISKQISRLEEELGIRIFERATKSAPVRLTHEGEQVMVELRKIMNCYKALNAKVERIKSEEQNRISVGYVRHLGHFHEKDILSRFLIEHPETVVQYRTGNIYEVMDMLRNHVLDAAILPIMNGAETFSSPNEALGSDEFIIDKLFSTSTLSLGMPECHPLAGCEMIKREQYPLLHGETFMLSTMQMGTTQQLKRDNLAEVLGFPGELRFRYVDISEPGVALKLIESGGGVLPQGCIVPRQMGGVRFVPLEDSGRSISVYFISHRSQNDAGVKLRRCALEFSRSYEN